MKEQKRKEMIYQSLTQKKKENEGNRGRLEKGITQWLISRVRKETKERKEQGREGRHKAAKGMIYQSLSGAETGR